MIAVTIGKTFLAAYNEKYKQSCTAKEFFEKEFFRLFYDYPKYMQWVTNSPFVQGVRKGNLPGASERREKFHKFAEKIKESAPDASIAIGFPSLDETATTSGQLTNLDPGFREEDVYASWIGGGLGIGVQGGLVIFLNVPEILLQLYEGWQHYRAFLEEMPELRPNQIDTWNGQWLAHVYSSKEYVESDPAANFDPTESSKGVAQVATQKWVRILAGIAQHFSNSSLTGYIFSLGQTNTTIGFIPFHLPGIRKPLDYYRHLFGENDFLQNAGKIEELLGSEFSFRASCGQGQIGLQAMQPKGLMPFVKFRGNEVKLPEYPLVPDIKSRKGESGGDFLARKRDSLKKYHMHLVTYKTYEGWIMATLDNVSLYEKAEKYARCFLEYEKGAGKGKMDRSNQVKQALKAKSRRVFIEELTGIIEKEKLSAIDELVEEVVKMPVDNFPYFLTLIRFRYAFLNQ